jgi:hypothetical protein
MLKGLYIFDAVQYKNPFDAQKNRALTLIPETNGDWTVAQLKAKLDAASFALGLACFSLRVCIVVGELWWFDFPKGTNRLAYLEDLIPPPIVLSFELVRDALPFLVDLLKDTGGPEGNPTLWRDLHNALDYLSGENLTEAVHDQLAKLIYEIEKNEKDE